MSLRLRIGGVLATLVVLNALFVLAVLWGFLVALPTVVTLAVVRDAAILGDLLRVPVSPLLYLGLVVVFLAGQLYYGYHRVLGQTSAIETESDHEIATIVKRLAMTVEIPAPEVRVVEDDAPSCYTVGRFTSATIVVSTGLVETLDADELEAVLAHEIAHIANRDVTLMTITTLFLEIAHRTYHASRLMRRAVFDTSELSFRERMALRWFLPLTLLVYLVVRPVLLLFPLVAGWATRTLAHAREFAADAASARITGNPLALATALITLEDRTTAPETDLRISRTQALCVFPMTVSTGSQATTLPDVDAPDTPARTQEISSWLGESTAESATGATGGTHPPVEQRIERLRDVATEMEGEP
jgi:heat shock protein HtpX